MREEYNSVLSTPTEVNKIGRFGRYRYIGKTQISADISASIYIGRSQVTDLREEWNISCLASTGL